MVSSLQYMIYYFLFFFTKLKQFTDLQNIQYTRNPVSAESLKDALMQIWKSPNMFVFLWKQYPENFAFLILRILKLFTREVYKFPKK